MQKKLPGWLDLFIVALIVVIGVATVLPVSGLGAEIFGHLTTVAVGLLFFLHGAKLSPQNAIRSFTRWRFQLVVLGFTYLLFPALALALLPLRELITPALFAGVIFLCVLPSTVQSSIAFTSVAGGNVGLAISSASVSNVLGVLITPLLAAALMGSAVKITGGSILGIIGQLLLPFLLGQLLHRRIGPWLARHKRVVTFVDRGSVLLVVYTAFSAGVVSGMWQQVAPSRIAMIVGICVLMLALVLTLAVLVARLSKWPQPDRVVLLMCGSTKSLASGLPMATLLFPAATVSMTVLPLMFYHLLQLITCAVMARLLARRSAVPEHGGVTA